MRPRVHGPYSLFLSLSAIQQCASVDTAVATDARENDQKSQKIAFRKLELQHSLNALASPTV